MTKVFTPKQIVKYAKTRLFGKNVPSERVQDIFLHNATLPSELKSYLSCGTFDNFEKVVQENGREPIYISGHELHIPQYSGFGRRKRYEDMIRSYIGASGREVDFNSMERKGDVRRTSINYDNFAYDFVAGLFVPDKKYEDRRVFEFDQDFSRLTKIIFGPTEAVAKQAKVFEKGNSEYLDAQIILAGDERVLNLGYVYADQAGILIDKILREYESIARKKGEKLTIDIYMFGRAGGLAEDMKRQDLVFPTGIVDEVELESGLVYPMKNILAPEDARGFNLNVKSVIDETAEQLEKAKDLGCICVEMETSESVQSVNRARKRYNGLLDVNFGFVGHVSDLPLQGDTVADELDSDEGEQKAVKLILKKISQN